jgi:hypothetical protein
LRIYPSWAEIEGLRTPLTEGERALAYFLAQSLSPLWTIYVQPYVNDMRPDVVALNINHGLVVFEVKDWTLGRYSFEQGRMIGRTSTSTWIEDDPAEKARLYARNFYEQFLVSDEATLQVGLAQTTLQCAKV